MASPDPLPTRMSIAPSSRSHRPQPRALGRLSARPRAAWPARRHRESPPGQCRLSSAGASARWPDAAGAAFSRIFDHAAKVHLEPVDGLFAPSGRLGRVVERRRVVLALARAGQLAGGHRRRCSLVLDFHVLGQLRLRLEGLGPEPGRNAVEFLRITELGEAERFGSVQRPGSHDQGRPAASDRARPAARSRAPAGRRDNANSGSSNLTRDPV